MTHATVLPFCQHIPCQKTLALALEVAHSGCEQ